MGDAHTPGGRAVAGQGGFVLTLLPADEGAQPREFTCERDLIRLGRAGECDVVIDNATVSRHHADIRRMGAGWQLVDAGSSNGTWVGNERVTESLLVDGQEFRLGKTRLRFALLCPAQPAAATVVAPPAPPPAAHEPARATPPPARPAPAAGPPPPPPPPPPRAAAPAPRPAPVPAAPASPPASAPTPAAPAAPPAPPAVAAPAAAAGPPTPAPGSPARASSPAAPAAAARPATTPGPAAPGAGPAGSLADVFKSEGELVLATGNQPFLLSRKDTVWYLESGKVEVFTVALDAGNQPVGARTHFISVEAGQVMFGMDLIGFAMGAGFLAVGRMGTHA
ncbi:MAG: FHA domain-containing protein, partial [Acidobacteriota bacterium]